MENYSGVKQKKRATDISCFLFYIQSPEHHVQIYIVLLCSDIAAYGGEEGIRTLVGLPPNGFQDRLVMTASIPLRM